MATDLITQERLQSLLTYDPDTGIFTSRVRRKTHRIGDKVGVLSGGGYLRCMLDRRGYALHHLAWLHEFGVWPSGQLDHINHDRTDNRIANLREVSCRENHHNRARKTRSASGYLGVTWHKRDQRWQAHIEIDGNAKYLGQYKDLNDAIAARCAAERIYHPSRPE